jgi:hypothetical protein
VDDVDDVDGLLGVGGAGFLKTWGEREQFAIQIETARKGFSYNDLQLMITLMTACSTTYRT